MSRRRRTLIALLSLLAFLTYGGDGLMAAICPPDMEMGGTGTTVEWSPEAAPDAATHDADAGHHGHPHTPGSDPEPCPIGMGSMTVCTGAATASAEASGPAPADESGSLAPAADPIPTTLHVLGLFRPPRG